MYQNLFNDFKQVKLCILCYFHRVVTDPGLPYCYQHVPTVPTKLADAAPEINS